MMIHIKLFCKNWKDLEPISNLQDGDPKKNTFFFFLELVIGVVLAWPII